MPNQYSPLQTSEGQNLAWQKWRKKQNAARYRARNKDKVAQSKRDDALKYPERHRAARLRWKLKVGKEYLNCYHRNYHKLNKDKLNAALKKRRQRPDFALKESTYRNGRVAIKQEYDKARYKLLCDIKKKQIRNWQIKNPDKFKSYLLKRRALKKSACGNLHAITNFVKRVRSKPRTTCYYCHLRIPSKGCHFDHIVPLSKGGLHSVENLCVSCPSCNCSKQDKSVVVWIKTGQTLLTL